MWGNLWNARNPLCHGGNDATGCSLIEPSPSVTQEDGLVTLRCQPGWSALAHPPLDSAHTWQTHGDDALLITLSQDANRSSLKIYIVEVETAEFTHP